MLYRNISVFFKMSIPAMWPTQPPFLLVSGSISAEIKRPGREAEHSPLFTTEVENEWGKYLYSPARPKELSHWTVLN
jgi:hypothetical protein